MTMIKVAIIGIGNCASSLIQGINYYKQCYAINGLMHAYIGKYKPTDIEVVLAFDIDERKVGKYISDAIFQPPNCTKVFYDDIPNNGIIVKMGKILDSISPHMSEYSKDKTFEVSDEKEPTKEEVIQLIKESKAEILLNYLPVGSDEATKFYADCAIEANVAFINNIPTFIASDPFWAKQFKDKNIPVIGDDIKSQLGATIIHRTLVNLFKQRGVKLERTYQLNTGGNTDFLNMLNRDRLISKKISKTEAVQSILSKPLLPENIHIGPSDYVPWLKDNKVCFLRMEGKLFGNVPMDIEIRLSVEDSPNSAGIVIDAIRCAKLALDKNIGGPLDSPSAYFMKHPPKQYTDDEAYNLLENFIKELSTTD